MSGKPNNAFLYGGASILPQEIEFTSIDEPIIRINADICYFEGVSLNGSIAAQLFSDPEHPDIMVTQQGVLPLVELKII